MITSNVFLDTDFRNIVSIVGLQLGKYNSYKIEYFLPRQVWSLCFQTCITGNSVSHSSNGLSITRDISLACRGIVILI